MTFSLRAIEVALAKFNEVINDPIMEPCPRCEAKGYHHGFGPGGVEPDWCENCGGNQYNIRPGEEKRAMESALTAALAVDGVALQGWQPIESAPVGDDDFFLVCGVGDDRSAFVVRGSILKNAHKANTPSHLHMHWLTHWMALPAPPPASDGEELPSPPQQWKP
jgi:hypothetical protein